MICRSHVAEHQFGIPPKTPFQRIKFGWITAEQCPIFLAMQGFVCCDDLSLFFAKADELFLMQLPYLTVEFKKYFPNLYFHLAIQNPLL